MASRKRKGNNIFALVLLIIFVGFIIYVLYNYYSNSNEIIKQNNQIKESTKEEQNNNTEENNSDLPKNENEQNKVEEKVRNLDVSSIELIGEEKVTVELNSKYSDQGAKAFNKNGEDISDAIKVDNSVDTSKKGEYTITYSIGNYIVMRFVTVQ